MKNILVQLSIVCCLVLSCKSRWAETQSDLLDVARFQELPADEDAIRPSAEKRLELLEKATVYETQDTRGTRTVLEGPMQFEWKKTKLSRKPSKEFAFNEVVVCDYLAPWLDDKPGGKTPKFYCQNVFKNADGKSKSRKLKVKYDSFASPNVNTGIYGEVLATRLFWLLGFPADTVFPVQLTCQGCPSEPWRHITNYWSLIESEQRLPGMDPSSKRFKDLKQDVSEITARLVADNLSRFEEFKDVRVKRDGDVVMVRLNHDVLYDSSNGVLNMTIGSKKIEWNVFDVGSGLPRKLDVGGYEDYAFAHLPAEVVSKLTPVKREFVSSVVESKHNSIPIETYYHQGWSIGVLEKDIDSKTPDILKVTKNNRELEVQRQELALLSAFISHADNKDEQQRFICWDSDKVAAEDNDCESGTPDPRNKVCKDGTDTIFETCDAMSLMIQDLGFSMGFGSKVLSVDASGRVKFDSSKEARMIGTADSVGFLKAKIFSDQDQCITQVNRWATGFDIQVKVTEEAKQRLVKKLAKLVANETDFSELFQSARLHLRKMHFEGRDAPKVGTLTSELSSMTDEEKTLVEDFKKSFAAKVDALSKITCPSP